MPRRYICKECGELMTATTRWEEEVQGYVDTISCIPCDRTVRFLLLV